MRLSGAMDAYQGVAVAAFVFQGEVEVERYPVIALGDHHRSFGQDGTERPRELGSEGRRQPIWRIEEDEIVVTSAAGCAAEEAAGLRADDRRGGVEVAQ